MKPLPSSQQQQQRSCRMMVFLLVLGTTMIVVCPVTTDAWMLAAQTGFVRKPPPPPALSESKYHRLMHQLLSFRDSTAHHSRSTVVTRLSAVSSSSSAAAAVTFVDDRAAARQLVRDGMNAFRAGNVKLSISCFDLAEQKQGPSLTPYLWQRGLSYYYDNQFAAASRQFRLDVQVNPVDVEEIVWDVASQLRSMQHDATTTTMPFPVPNQLSLPPGTSDRRRIMPTVYKLFRGEGTEHDLAVAGHPAAGASPADEFYALFYLGLYCEARGETNSKAETYMRRAARTKYALASGDYMAACAAVHCKLRGWT